MEYLFLGLIVWAFISLPALIYAGVVDGRRRRDAENFNHRIAELTREMDILERRTHALAASPTVTAPAEASVHKYHPPAQKPEEVVKPVSAPIASKPEPITQKPVASVVPPVAAREITSASPVPSEAARPSAPPGAASTPAQPSAHSPAQTPSAIPPRGPAQPATPLAQKETSAPVPPVLKPEIKISSAEANLAARVQAPAPPPMRNVNPPVFQQIEKAPRDRAQLKKKSLSLEEALGTNWFPKLGITAVVIGIGLLVGASWGAFAPWLRVAILYCGGLGLLAGGILLERKEQYRILGRSLIGGGWAVTFLVSYAISHARSLLVLTSQPADLFLMLAVAGAMVWHTLKYDSQLVTGISFLLGFTAVALNSDPPYNLIAGAILVAGMTVIVLRRQWFELEVFGILASYLNHLLWLYPIVESMGSHKHDFAQFPASVALLGFYWLVFRASYLLRKPETDEKEKLSTVAGLLNPVLLLGVMKYQSFHPEMAFYALLALGTVEFILGQLPSSRKRVAPFRLLSSLGATLMLAAVPFKYSGNSLEILWLAGGEAFLLAGIFTRERLFRGFGLIISFMVALYSLAFHFEGLIDEISSGKAHYHAELGLVFAVVAATFYANSHIARWLWPELFEQELETQALTGLSFAASLFSVAATFALVGDAAVPLVLMSLVTVLSWSGRDFKIPELVYESHWIAALAIAQLIFAGQNQQDVWHGIPFRFVMFVPAAALLYLSSRFVRLSETRGKAAFSSVYAWAGTGLLAVLIWFQMPDWSIAVFWLALGLALCAAAELFQRNDLKWQAFVLALLAFTRAITFNFTLTATTHHMSYRLITVSLVAVGIYLLARWAPLAVLRPVYTVLGTFLLAYLAYDEAPQPWTGCAWIMLAAALCVAARFWKDRALLLQTHLLSLLAVGWTFYTNFAPQYRGGRMQLISVGITAAVLYLLNWNTNIPKVIEDERMAQGYSWAASLLLSWLAWYQLDPANVSLAWGLFGLLLFEIPELARFGGTITQTNLCAQCYVALISSFAHLFYSNFDTRATGTWTQVLLDPRVLTVLPLIVIFFWVYTRLQSMNTGPGATPNRAAAKGAGL
jgi:hypothetical protein